MQRAGTPPLAHEGSRRRRIEEVCERVLRGASPRAARDPTRAGASAGAGGAPVLKLAFFDQADCAPAESQKATRHVYAVAAVRPLSAPRCTFWLTLEAVFPLSHVMAPVPAAETWPCVPGG